jgi:hypothetical protein
VPIGGAIAGLIFVLTQLTGTNADTQIAQTLYTVLATSFFMVLGSVGVALIRFRPRFSLLGAATATLSLLAFGAFVASIWSDGSFGFGFGFGGTSAKVAWITLLLAFATSAASALTLVVTDWGDNGFRIVGLAGIGALWLFVGLAILAIADSSVEISARAFAIIATVYVVAAAILLVLRLVDAFDAAAEGGNPPHPLGRPDAQEG